MPAEHNWEGEVTVLVDAMTYSAAEDFLHPLVGLAHGRIVGGPSGGGASGRPHTRLIKDGVRLATSTAITSTSGGDPIEYRGPPLYNAHTDAACRSTGITVNTVN